MTALGLSRADVERTVLGLMRDLERTCSCCCDKGRCAHDLARRPEDPAWKHYCPNAIALEATVARRGASPRRVWQRRFKPEAKSERPMSIGAGYSPLIGAQS